MDVLIDFDNKINNNLNKKNDRREYIQPKEAEKINNLTNLALDLYDEKEFNEKIFEISDFIPGRISQISNDIEKMNLEGIQRESVIKRDFNSNKKLIGNGKNNNRLTIDIIAKDVGLINDEIDYSELNHYDFQRRDYSNRLNDDLKNNLFLEQMKESNNQFKKNIDKDNIKEIKEQIIKKENNYAFINKTNNNNNLNRITQIGPLHNLNQNNSSDEISFSINDSQIIYKDKKIEQLAKPLTNKNDTINNNNLLDQNPINNINSHKPYKMLEINQIEKEAEANINENISYPVSIPKNQLNNQLKDHNISSKSDKINILELNNMKESNFKGEKARMPALILSNKLFETNIKNYAIKESNQTEIQNIDKNELLKDENKKIVKDKKNISKKLTIGIKDLLNFQDINDSSEYQTSNRTSEINKNKFNTKRKSIKRNTLNYFKNCDFNRVSISSSDEEKKNLNKNKTEIAKETENQNTNIITNEDINKEENKEINKMDICDENKQSPSKNACFQNKNVPNREEFENDIVMNEAEEILKNLENNVYSNYNKNMSLLDQNKLNNYNSTNSMNNNNNPFLSAMKKSFKIKEKDNIGNNDNNITTPITPYKKDDYLLATPGKYYISNNSSKIKEKDFSKFTGFMPNFNLQSQKILKLNDEVKEYIEDLNIINTSNNKFLINDNINRTISNNLLDNKATSQKEMINNRVTINRLVDIDIDEENEEFEHISSDENKINPCNKINNITYQSQHRIMQDNIETNKQPLIKDIIDENKLDPKVKGEIIKINLAQAPNDNIENTNEILTIEDMEYENKAIENISFSQFANDNTYNLNMKEELDKADDDYGPLSKKIRDRNKKLYEYLKEIFKSRFSKMKNVKKNFNEKEEHLKTLRNHIEVYKKEINFFEKEMQAIDSKKKFFKNFDKYYKFFSRKFINTKILGIEFNTIKIIFANTLNISFIFEEFSHKIFHDSNCGSENNLFDIKDNNNYSSEKLIFEGIKLNESQKNFLKKKKLMLKDINFFFISSFMDELKLKDKLIQDPDVNKVYKRMIIHTLNMIFTNKNKKFYSMNIFEFIEGYKIFIEAVSNIIYLIKQFYLWDSIFNNVYLNFDEGKALLTMTFCINCQGYNLILTFTCDILDAFLSYDFIHYEIIREYISENELTIERSRIDRICENIKSFLENKHKLFNPYFFVNFIQNVKKKIVENNLCTSKN